MENLFNAWQNIKERLESAKAILLLLDFDGTITPIAKRPQEAELSPEMARVLKLLSRKKGFKVAIISGRSLSDLEEKIGLRSIIYVGNHGLEIARGRERFIYPEALESIPTMRKLKKSLKRELKSIKGAILEDKRVGLAVHYRMVKNSDLQRLRRVVGAILRPFEEKGKIRIGRGKKIIEAKPPIIWDKGKATIFLLDSFRREKPLSIFLGDDRTDEDAFSALDGKGITVLVGRPRKSKANFFLRSVAEAGLFLRKLCSLQFGEAHSEHETVPSD